MKDTKWIVATGLDGSGKTTLVEALERYYTSLGKSVKRSRLPFDRYIVKELLDKSTSKYCRFVKHMSHQFRNNCN